MKDKTCSSRKPFCRADADLTDNVSTTIALINERAWGDTTNVSTDIDLLLAYVTLREMLYSPLTVVVGKQAFHYGNSFIIDSAGANNAIPADSGLSWNCWGRHNQANDTGCHPAHF